VNASHISAGPEKKSSFTRYWAYHEEQRVSRIEASLEQCRVCFLDRQLFRACLASKDPYARRAVLLDFALKMSEICI